MIHGYISICGPGCAGDANHSKFLFQLGHWIPTEEFVCQKVVQIMAESEPRAIQHSADEAQASTSHEQGNKRIEQEPDAKRLCSALSIIPSFERFTNRTQRNVAVIWINYEGGQRVYRRLTPGQFVDVNTFIGHPWIFRDLNTGDELVANKQEVYHPRSLLEGPPQRNIVYITVPVYTLVERCLQVIRQCVQNEQDYKELGLPTKLVKELRREDTSTK